MALRVPCLVGFFFSLSGDTVVICFLVLSPMVFHSVPPEVGFFWRTRAVAESSLSATVGGALELILANIYYFIGEYVSCNSVSRLTNLFTLARFSSQIPGFTA